MPDSNRGNDNRGAGYIGRFDPDFKHGQEVHGDLRVKQPGTSDAFGKLIADSTQNTLDIPSHYNFNPERLRYFENGSRVVPDTSAKFTDLEASYRLEPDAGDCLTLYSAERPRYIVGYEGLMSCAAKLDTALGSGDTFRVGLDDRQSPANRAFFEFTDSGQRAVLIGSGSEVATESFELPDTVSQTDPIRFEIQYNWYNVGRYLFTISYTDETEPLMQRQKIERVASLTVDDDYATGDGNFHLFQELDATNSGLQVRCGSFGHNILGNVSPSFRTKSARIAPTGNNYSGSGQYEALAAVRIDPDRGNVYSSFSTLEVTPDAGSGEMVVIVVRSSETDATGFSTPPQHSPKNSVIEQTTNVSTFPDQNGNLVTSAANPNGYQVAFSALSQTGQGSKTTRDSNTIVNKRPLYEDDVAIFLYKADTATARNVKFIYAIEQDW